MKKSILLALLFVSTTLISFAQMKKGKITYDMAFSSDNADMAMAANMMQGSKMMMSFMPGKSRTDVTMGMMGTMITITQQKDNKSLSLMDMMGMKYAIEQTTDQTTAPNNYTVEITSETKVICGYTCTKALMTDESGNVMTVWFTKEIQVYTNGQNYYNQQIPGFPLAFTLMQSELKIEMTATSVEKKVSKKDFSMTVPEGYELKTPEELQMLGQ